MFTLRISSLILRYNFMILVGVIAVLTQQSWLILFTFLIAASAILGYRIEWPRVKEKGKVVTMEGAFKKEMRKAV